MGDEYGTEEEYDEPVEQPVQAPPPFMSRQWSWNTNTLLWSALGVLGAGFIIWFLMSYSGARARAIMEAANSDGN
jgi:hypothetical protein